MHIRHTLHTTDSPYTTRSWCWHRSRSQDLIRVQNLTTLRNALELYYADNNEYPKTFDVPYTVALVGNQYRSECPHSGNVSPYIPNLAPKYIAALPSDPTLNCAGATYSFFYASNGTDYKLITHPKNNSFPDFMDMSEGYWRGHYGVWTKDAAGWIGM
jgi:hypothetical protein